MLRSCVAICEGETALLNLGKKREKARKMSARGWNVTSRAEAPLQEGVARGRNERGRNMHELASILLTEEWLSHDEEREPFEWINFAAYGVLGNEADAVEHGQVHEQTPSLTSRTFVEPESTLCDQFEWLDDILVNELLEEEHTGTNIPTHLISQLDPSISVQDAHEWAQECQERAEDQVPAGSRPQATEKERSNILASNYVIETNHSIQPPKQKACRAATFNYGRMDHRENLPFSVVQNRACETFVQGEQRSADDPFEGSGRIPSSQANDDTANLRSPGSRKEVENDSCIRGGTSRSISHSALPKNRVLDERKRSANRRAAARSHVKKTLTSKLLRVEYSEQQKRLDELQQEKRTIEMAIASAQKELEQLQTHNNSSSHTDQHKAAPSICPQQRSGD